MTLEQTLIEHSGCTQEQMEKLVREWAEEHPNVVTDEQLGIGDYKPYQPNCCKKCPNSKNDFCQCVRPSQEMIAY